MTEEVIAPEGEVKETVHVKGDSFEIFKSAASTFVPALADDMPEEERKSAVRKMLQQSASVDDRLKLIQGELLYEVKNNEYWKEWTFRDEEGADRVFDTLDEYADAELGMKRRQMIYLVDIYETYVVKLGLDKEVLGNLEWSKAKELTKVIDEENAAELLDKVAGMSVRETIEYARELKGAKGLPGGVAEKFETLSFRVTEDQKKNIDAALDLAGAMSKSDKKAQQLDFVCSDFHAGMTGEGTEGAIDRLEHHIKSLSRTFGVKLEIVETTDGRYDAEEASAEEAEVTA